MAKSFREPEREALADPKRQANIEREKAELLRLAQDPVVARLDAAPYDDEPFTDEQRKAVKTALGEPAMSSEQAESELAAD